MKTRAEVEKKLIEIKPFLMEQFHVSRIGYFGSYALEEQTEHSDIDILVEFSEPIGWKFFTLEQYLEDLLAARIDLVTKNALKDQLKENILSQVRYI